MVAITDPHCANIVTNVINSTDKFEKTVSGQEPVGALR